MNTSIIKTKAAFLDRDGVINEETNYLHKINDFKYTTNCVNGLLKLQKLGYILIIITNQAGIAKGVFSEKDFQILSDWMLNDFHNNGIKIKDLIHCPHHPEGIIEKYKKDCDFRKPKPGMLNYAKKKYNIDMNNSILIGDKLSDIEAAKAANVGKFYLVESGHRLDPKRCSNIPIYPNLYEIACSLKK